MSSQCSPRKRLLQLHAIRWASFLLAYSFALPELNRQGRVIAGVGSPGINAAGCGSGASPELDAPVDISISPDGHFYMLDHACRRIIKFPSMPLAGQEGVGVIEIAPPQGSFTNQLNNPEGIVYDPSSGDIFIADTSNNRILRWAPGASTGTLVAQGSFQVNVGNVVGVTELFLLQDVFYTVETHNNRIARFDISSCCADPLNPSATLIYGCPDLAQGSCFTGTSIEYLNIPQHVFVTPALEFYITDTYNHRIVLYDMNKTISDPNATLIKRFIVAGTSGIAGCGPEQLRFPQASTVDKDGYLYVADTGNHRIQKFAVKNGEHAGITVAGECCCPRLAPDGSPIGGSGLWQLNQPVALDFDLVYDTLLVADKGNSRVLSFENTSDIPRTIGANCAYGVECNILIEGELRSRGGAALVAHRKLNETLLLEANITNSSGMEPCGSAFCSIAAWPGFLSPVMLSGPFLDIVELGLPEGPWDTDSSGLGGDYVVCLSRNPSFPCVGSGCGGIDNCTNSTSWLCQGSQPFGIRRKVWTGIAGDNVADLRASSKYPKSPDVAGSLGQMFAPQNWGDYYGQQLIGLFTAQETGTHLFHLTSDMTSELWISDVYNTTGQLVAYISMSSVTMDGAFYRYGYATSVNDWSSFATQTGTFEMEAGEIYMVEVLHKEHLGADHLVVGVTLPSGQVLKPIPGSYFEAKTCTVNLPSALGVIHDCDNIRTGQTCTAHCRSGFLGSSELFRCDGQGAFMGYNPVCDPIDCTEYTSEIGSFFMHGTMGQPATTAVSAPFGMTQDSYGNAITVDSQNHVVVRWWGSRCEVVAGGSGPGKALNQLQAPGGVYFRQADSTSQPYSLYVADMFNHRIMEWAEGSLSGTAFFGTGIPGANLTQLRYPAALNLDSNGSLIVRDYGNRRILQIDLNVHAVSILYDEFNADVGKLVPDSAAETFFDGKGNSYTVDYGSHSLSVCLRKFSCSFDLCRDTDPSASYGLSCGCTTQIGQCQSAYGVFPGGAEHSSQIEI